MPRARLLLAAAAACVLTLSACAGGGPSDVPGGAAANGSARTVRLYGFGVAKVAYERLIPAFARTRAGAGIQFQESYGASGDQSRKVAAGAAADFVALSVAPDITRLVSAGRVPEQWDAGPRGGVPFGSVVVFVVRPGNPKGIRDWPDLLRGGVEVVTPNPLSSGAAKWNLLAPYAVYSDGGARPGAGLAYLRALLTGGHVKLQPQSGREASEAFLQGSGDVLISYENEALFLQRQGEAVQTVHPPRTFRIDLPVAVVPGGDGQSGAEAFSAYLYTAGAQQVAAEAGFRPVDEEVLRQYAASFPVPEKLWTIGDLGGWAAADAQLFDPDEGTISAIYDEASQ